MRILKVTGLVCFLFLTFAANDAMAQLDGQGNAYMKNQYIQAALASYGVYGSTSNSVMPTGYYSPANASYNGKLGFIASPDANWPFYYGDFMLPGDPYEAIGITFNDGSGVRRQFINSRSDGGTSGSITPKNPAFTYHNDDYNDLTWHGIVAGYIEVDCRFTLDGRRIIHRTTVKNISGSTLTNVYFTRAVDPDQENGSNSSGIPPDCNATPATYNFIESQADGTPGTFSWVTANGYCAPSSISYYCTDPNSRVGISAPWRQLLDNPELAFGIGTKPFDLYLDKDEYSRTEAEDWTIELVIAMGSIANGESKTVEHDIRLDQPPVVSFSGTTDFTKKEGETFTYNVKRDYQLDERVTVVLRLTSVTGASAADFADVPSLPMDYTLIFEPGETAKTISIRAAYDAVSPEPDERFQLEIVSVNSTLGGLATVPSKAYGTIQDVPLPIATITASPASIEEGGAAATVTITLSKAPISEIGPAIINLSYGGTATFTTDYTVTPGTNTINPTRIVIPVGQTSATFTLQALLDGIYEPGGESVIITMAHESGAAVGTPPSTTINIIDKNTPPVLSISNASATEGSNLSFELTLTGDLCSQNITAAYATVDGTALAPADYVAAGGTVVFEPGENRKVTTVATLNDDWLEGNESMYLTLSLPVNCTLSGGGATLSGEGTIEDITPGDIIVVLVEPTVGSKVGEADLTNGKYRIRFKDENVKATKNVQVTYTLTDSRDGSVKNYSVTPSPAIILAGDNGVDIPVTIINNFVVESKRELVITINSATAI